MTTAPTIPREALENHIVFLAKTGAGKSNAAKTVVEGMLDRDERVCVIDPTGTWYGLRLMPNGKASPYKVLIFGGNHADVQISGGDGAAIAEVVGTSATSCIIDTRLLSVGDRTRFFTAFAETLLAKNVGVLNLVIDEAHLFAPKGKVNDPKSGMMLGAASNLVSLGRGIGLRIIMLSQRPAKFHNDCLSCAETLVAMRMLLPADRDAVMAWVKEHADAEQGKQIASSLSALPTGDAWIWSPQIDLLERRHFPLVKTKDTGRPPRPDEEKVDLEPLQIDEISARLKQVAAEVLANDPRALKAEVARLTRELAKAGHASPAPAWPDQRELVASLTAELAEHSAALERLTATAWELQSRQQAARAALSGEDVTIPAVTPPQRRVAPAPAPVQRQAPPARTASTSDGEVPAGCAKPLAALAAVYPSGLTEPQWATAAGYKRSGGTWGTYKSRLRGAGLIESREGRWFATEAGASAVGDVELPPPPGPDLVRWWAAKLPGTSRMAEALIEAHPQGLTREDLAFRLDMAASGGSFGTYLSRLAGPGLIERGATIRLSADVMP